MGKRKDLKQTETGDIYINPVTGDFEIVESDSQHVSDIMQSVSGDYKEYPLMGVNFYQVQNSTGQQQEFEGRIRTMLIADGYNPIKITIPLSITSFEDIRVQANAPSI